MSRLVTLKSRLGLEAMMSHLGLDGLGPRSSSGIDNIRTVREKKRSN